MEEILDGLTQVPGIQGCMVVGKDGLVIAAAGDAGVDSDLAGVTAAEIFTGAESAAAERLSRGETGMISIEAGEGSMFLRNIDEVTFLLVMAEAKLNLGLVRYEIRRAADRLRENL